jgi:phosphoesterase RecJ-like protein
MSMEITLEEAVGHLKAAQSIIITAHVNPDGDALGSSLGLMHILQTLGKKVQILIDDDLPPAFAVLPGYDEISKPQEKVSADLLVVLDTELARTGTVPEMVKARAMLNIDHHRTNDHKIPWLYLDAQRAATAEIVYEINSLLQQELEQKRAMCIYTGMATDSGFFRFSNTTPFTMRAAADLLEHGVQPQVISEALERKPYALIQGMAKAMQSIEIFAEGKVSGMFLDQEFVASVDTTEGFIGFARVITGVDVAVLVKEKEKALCRVSMRSRFTDVSVIAQAFGGGGHIRAAGCTLQMPLAEAKKTILKAIIEAVQP